MMQIIPVINCPDLACVQHKIELLKSFLPAGRFIHLDVADGAFTFHKTWNDPSLWGAMNVPFDLEVHLMVEHPEAAIAAWLAAGAKRFIVQAESIDKDSLASMTRSVHAAGATMGLSSDPETPIRKLAPYLHSIRFFQVLAVNPGLAGQPFLPLMVPKIKWLRANAEHAIIEVDGGMNPATARLVKNAGADVVVSASYIFGNKKPKRAYEELERA